MQPPERDQIAQAIALCRENQLEEGYAMLKAAALEGFPENCPSAAYSYWGYGMAALEAHYNDGVAACLKAVDIEFYQPENFWNLARTYLLLGARRKAIEALDRGLQIDPGYAPLVRLQQRLGSRNPPVLRMLHRNHWLNRWLGARRYELRHGTSKQAGEE